MAVAGLHNASGLDSYLGNKERSITRTASIRKMWRDLENGGRGKENGRLQTSSVIIGPESPCSSSLEGESIESEHTFRGANEIENECPQSQNQMVLQEKEGVRKLFHERGNKSFEGHAAYGCKRVRIVREWIESSSQQGDTCRTPGSVESPTQTGAQIDGARSSIRRIYGRQALLDLLTKFVSERKREVDDLLENRFVSSFAHRHRIQSLLKGRFLRNQRFLEDEKPTSVAASELGFLRRTNAVSDIRKGFLTRLNNYGHAAQSDSDTSSDNEMNNYDIEQAEEIVQEITNLTCHRASLDLPESSSATGATHDNNILQYEETERPPLTVHYSRHGSQYDTTYEHNGQVEQVGRNFETTNFTSNRESTYPQEYTQTDSDSDTSSDNNDMKFDRIDQAEEIVRDIPNISHIPQESHDDGGWYQETAGSDFQESNEEEWYDNGNVAEGPTESWFGRNNSYLEAALVTRSNTFYWSDDDDSGSRVVELRELTNRRRVSNLLQSDFGPRLDQLMQSYVSRQDQAFESENEWMQHHDQHQSLDENEDGIDASPQTHGGHDLLHGAADSRFPDSHYHLATELDIINGLRIDMEILEQRMNNMQKMLEACMDMQVELQQSMQQEVYSALNRSSPENGECFLCCDNGFESLPDRFAQMLHICSKCAQKVNWSKLKESVRQP